MPSLHVFKRKALSIAAVGAIAAILIPTGVPAQSVSESLDLPIALLQPADVTSAGFEDYGLVMGWTASTEDLAYDMVNRQGYDEADAQRGVEESGIGTIFFQSLHPIATPADGPLVGVAIETSITAFTDTEHAEDGIDYMRLAEEEAMVADPPSFGDYTEMSETDYPAGEVSELPLHEIDVVMRFDNIVARFSLLGYDTEVEQADAVALAEVYGDKVDALINGEKIGSRLRARVEPHGPDLF